MHYLKSLWRFIYSFVIVILSLVILFFVYMIFFSNESSGQYIKGSYIVDQSDQIKVILDCDNSLGSFWEVDDGLVLSYLLNKPEANLLGITTTFGNRTYDHKYTLRMLERANRAEIPLFKGEQTADEGITEAAIFLAETVAQYPDQVSIIAAGPVGNLAAAQAYDDNFFDNVKQITVMGGYTEDLTMGGRQVDELNLSADYLATQAMFQSGAKVTVMTGQACLDAPFRFSDFAKLETFPVDWEFFCAFWAVLNKIGTGNSFFIVWDMLPTSYIFHPEYFVDNTVYVNSTVEDLKKGMLKLSNSKEGHAINLPAGIEQKDAYFTDFMINLNRQGRLLSKWRTDLIK
jgi:purine nucleosidase